MQILYYSVTKKLGKENLQKKELPPSGSSFFLEREGILRGDYKQETRDFSPASRLL